MKKTHCLILPILVTALVLVVGCFDEARNTEELCLNNPSIRCDELNIDDGQCRIPRTDLIWHRFNVINQPTDANKIKEYYLTSAYRKCLEVSTQILAIDQTELKRTRFNALMSTGSNIERLEQELAEFHTPKSLYFLWSQTGDIAARREFLQHEGQPELETAEMQYNLATFYTDINADKTIMHLLRALELSPKGNFNIDIPKSLSSIYKLTNKKEMSYIWAKVSEAYGVNIASKKELDLMFGFDDKQTSALEDIAADVVEAINEGEFKPTLIPSQYN
jgi:hypothetical protein